MCQIHSLLWNWQQQTRFIIYSKQVNQFHVFCYNTLFESLDKNTQVHKFSTNPASILAPVTFTPAFLHSNMYRKVDKQVNIIYKLEHN